MAIRLDATYRTRDGRPVRIYAVDGGYDGAVHGAILMPGVGWLMTVWHHDGKMGAAFTAEADLIEVRPMRRVTGWINVWESPSVSPERQVSLHQTRELADMYAYGSSRDLRIACIEIDVETEDLSGG